MDDKEFKKRLKKLAKNQNIFYDETRQGKGSHSRVYFGDSYIDYKVSKKIKSEFVVINGYSDDTKLCKYKSIYKYKNFLDF